MGGESKGGGETTLDNLLFVIYVRKKVLCDEANDVVVKKREDLV